MFVPENFPNDLSFSYINGDPFTHHFTINLHRPDVTEVLIANHP